MGPAPPLSSWRREWQGRRRRSRAAYTGAQGPPTKSTAPASRDVPTGLRLQRSRGSLKQMWAQGRVANLRTWREPLAAYHSAWGADGYLREDRLSTHRRHCSAARERRRISLSGIRCLIGEITSGIGPSRPHSAPLRCGARGIGAAAWR